MIVVEFGFLIDIDTYLFLPDDQQIANKQWFYISNSRTFFLKFFDCYTKV